MSLKHFHVFFIAVSAFLSAGLGWWGLSSYPVDGQTADLVLAVAGIVGALALTIYLAAFLRKMAALTGAKVALAVGLVAAWFGLSNQAAVACAVCTGAANTAMTRGMNMGILSMLLLVLVILLSFAAFFMHLRRQAKRSH